MRFDSGEKCTENSDNYKRQRKAVCCDSRGTASIEYEEGLYENVKILDNNLITWINDTDRTLDTVGICFLTDENGNIAAGELMMRLRQGTY